MGKDLIEKILDAMCDRCNSYPCDGHRHGCIQECWTIWNLREVLEEVE